MCIFAARKRKKMEIIAIIVFFILAIIEGRKEKRDPTYRSWMDDGSVRTFHRPGQDEKSQ